MKGHETSSPALLTRSLVLAAGHPGAEEEEATASPSAGTNLQRGSKAALKGKLHVCSDYVHICTSVTEVS